MGQTNEESTQETIRPKFPESVKMVDRENFMKAQVHDVLKKREDFAISLRKKKKQEIIKNRRKRLMMSGALMPYASDKDPAQDGHSTILEYLNKSTYHWCPLIEEEAEMN